MEYHIGRRAYLAPENFDFVAQDQAFFSVLSHLDCIELQGDQAKNFLQGQFTNNVEELKVGQLQKNLLCHLNGQVIAKIYLFKHQDRLQFLCPKDLSPIVLKTLERPAALARVKFTRSSSPIFGYYQAGLEEEDAFRLDDQTCIRFVPTTAIPNQAVLVWHYHRLKAMDFEIYPETSRLFLPHDLQLEQSHWLHFQKGCYRGQEIIARMHYRGKSKYQLQAIEQECNQQPVLGEAIDASGQIVIDYCPLDSQRYLILVKSKRMN